MVRPSVPLRAFLDQRDIRLFLIAFSLRALRVFAANNEIPADDRRYIAVVHRHLCLQ
jgi:hypothetical protein